MVTINMDLPDTCSSCRLSVRHFGKLYCPPLDGRDGNEGKDSRCPLVDTESRGDLISRQAAVDALGEEPPVWYECEDEIAERNQWRRDVNAIKALPSAQQGTARRTVGKSRNGMTFWCKCDMCNEPVDVQDRFCRGCGRRLSDG